jgi:hypothetical protein
MDWSSRENERDGRPKWSSGNPDGLVEPSPRGEAEPPELPEGILI